MTRTEIQTTGFEARTREAGNRAGVALYATHTPTLSPTPTSPYPYSPTRRTAGPTHRTALIGITGLALLLAAMGGIAFLRYQDTAAGTAATVAVPQSVYDSQVPAAPLGVSVAQSVYDSQVPAAPLAVTVPHGALAALGADAAPAVTVPQSVYDSQVPAAPLGVTVPQSTIDSQVPEAAR
jgi:hypothetical protein